MTGTEIPVSLDDKPRLSAMFADYLAEMSRFLPGADPHAPYPWFDHYWQEAESRLPFWLVCDNSEAGFALVRREAETGDMDMAEFYVAPAFRRRGAGHAAARRLIARFPGTWRISQLAGNAPAIAFWHRVLDGFVRYDETTTRNGGIARLEQRFSYP